MYIEDAIKEKKEVTLRGWVSELRDLKKVKFIILRDKSGVLQITIKDKPELEKRFEELTKESYIEVKGKIEESKIAKLGAEMFPSEIKIISKSEQPVPIDISGKIETSLDKRLDWRFLDLRKKEVSAIFSIQSEITHLFREFFRSKGFIEVWPPSIISEATEGGTELFKVDYFGKKAFLAQSPQLYKQLLVLSNLDKVFSITPVWRAELHDTSKHLNEIRQMDIEMANANDETVMKFLEDFIKYLFRELKTKCSKELETLGRDLENPKVVYLTYNEVIKVLNENGLKINYGEDISSDAEKKLSEIYGKNTMIFIKKWPTELKPFYIIPDENNPKLSRGFDMDMGGIEISSGGQRVHKPEILIERIKKSDLNPKDFEFYINSFKYGAPPHAGWSIGLERLTMVVCGLKNIREACLFPRDRNRLTP